VPIWVVNSGDWIDVEHRVRKMLFCETSDCPVFHSIHYIFFRSCAVSHVAAPSDFLKPCTYRFPESSVCIEITKVHEEGVLEVECYYSY